MSKTKKFTIIALILILVPSAIFLAYKSGWVFKKSSQTVVDQPNSYGTIVLNNRSEAEIVAAFEKQGSIDIDEKSTQILAEVNQKIKDNPALNKQENPGSVSDPQGMISDFIVKIDTNDNVSSENKVSELIKPEAAQAANSNLKFMAQDEVPQSWQDTFSALETQLESYYSFDGKRINPSATRVVLKPVDVLCNNYLSNFCGKPSPYNGGFLWSVNTIYIASDRYTSSTATTPTPFSDADIKDLFVHEMSHAFRGSKLLPEKLFEEGFAVAAEGMVLPGYSATTLSVFEMSNLSFRGSYYYTSGSMFPYLYGSGTWLKFWVENPDFFKTYHQKLAANNSALTMDSMVQMANQSSASVENTITYSSTATASNGLDWFHTKYGYFPVLTRFADAKYLYFDYDYDGGDPNPSYYYPLGYALKDSLSYLWLSKSINTFNLESYDARSNLISTIGTTSNTDPNTGSSYGDGVNTTVNGVAKKTLGVAFGGCGPYPTNGFCTTDQANALRHQFLYSDLLGGTASDYYNNYYGRVKFVVYGGTNPTSITQYSLKPHNRTNPIIGVVTGGGQQAKLYNAATGALIQTVDMWNGMFEFTNSAAAEAGKYKIEIIVNGSVVKTRYLNKTKMGVATAVTITTPDGSIDPPEPPGTVSLMTSTPTINSGSTATLTWASDHLQTCSFTDGTPNWRARTWDTSITTGTFTSEALTVTTAFTLKCTDTSGTALSSSVTINVTASPPPPTSSIDIKANGFSPLTINSSSSVTISWSGSNIGNCQRTMTLGSDPGWSTNVNGMSGSYVTPVLSESTTYKLDCASTIIGAPNVITEIRIIFSAVSATSKGHCTFKGNNKVNAVMLCQTEFKLDSTASNSRFTGSFVADQFRVTSGLYNIDFIYNPQLDSSWPPAFRYLNMPSPKETGNVE